VRPRRCLTHAKTRSFTLQDGDDEAEWRRVLAVNLTAVLEGARLATQRWLAECEDGTRDRVLLLTSSASAFFPLPAAEAYTAAKAGVVALARAMAPLQRKGVRAVALCPAFTDTPLVKRTRLSPRLAAAPLLPVREVAEAALFCLSDGGNAGAAYFVPQAGAAARYWRFPGGDERASAPPPRAPPPAARVAWAAGALPQTAEAVEVHSLSRDFGAATRIAARPVRPPPPGHALVRRAWAGVNASDVNLTSGRYFGSAKEAQKMLPFVAGFESVGVIAAIGEGDAGGWRVGDSVGALTYGGFAQYACEPLKALLPCPATPVGVALLTSGLTASLALEQALRLKRVDVLLVTAAAGGAGQFACALGLCAGAVVVATCGGEAKAARLRAMGVTRVIDYRAEDVRAVLRSEYPAGVTAAFESVGGAMLDTVLDAMAVRGRLCIIGAMSRYASGWAPPEGLHAGFQDKLLWKSVSAIGFFLPHYAKHFRTHLQRLVALEEAGLLPVQVDGERFCGLNRAADAVARLQSGHSAGKVVLQIAATPPPQADARL